MDPDEFESHVFKWIQINFTIFKWIQINFTIFKCIQMNLSHIYSNGFNRPRLKITPVATTRTTTPEATTRMPLNFELHTHAPVWDGVKRATQVSGNSVGA
jgi:hypothetical protein